MTYLIIKPTALPSTGSVPSLAAGLLFGLLAAVGAYLQSRNPQNVWLSLGEKVWVFFCSTVAGQMQISLTLFPCRHLGDSGCGDGTEISQLLEVHASWFDDFSEVIHFSISCTM